MKTRTFRALLSLTVFLLLLTLIAWTAASCSDPLEEESGSESESETETEVAPSGNRPTIPNETESETDQTASLPAPNDALPQDKPTGDPAADLDAMTEEVLADLQQQLEDIKTLLLGSAAALPYTYTMEGNAVTVTGYTGTDTAVTVPAMIEDKPVVAIGEKAFAGTAVQSVTLPETVTSVEWFAFWQCAGLRQLYLPASVASIGYAAFDGCSPALTLLCPADSYAARYAKSYGIATRPDSSVEKP